MTYLFDTGAWVEFFIGGKKGAKVKRMMEGNTILTAESTLAELLTYCLRHAKDFNQALAVIRGHGRTCEVYLNVWIEAAAIKETRRKTHEKFGLIDGILVALQRVEQATIVTTDRDFAGLPNVVVL